MKITIYSTTMFVETNCVTCRVWEGQTERGIKIQCLIPRIAAERGQDLTQFEAELMEQSAPSVDTVQAFPLRMIL